MPQEPKCSFRLMGLSDEKCLELINSYLHGIDYRRGSSYKDRSKKSLIILLTERIPSHLLKNLVNDAPDGAMYDFFVSVSTSEQTAIIEIPPYILGLYGDVGGKVNFSFTCVFDPE